MFATGMKQFSFFSLLIGLTGLIALTTGVGCANIVPPSGGPRDSLPPRLVRASPKDSTTHFRGKKIELEFDEFVDLQDVQQNLLFTPTFQTNPTISAKLRTLTINLRDTLEPNTTYSFNFGDAIKDINEGNVLKNFTYTFSTGPALDSLTLSGNVFLAETGKVDTTLMVVLYKNLQDSAVIRERPRYITRLNGSGQFTFKNLPPGTFAVYALSDQSGSHRYQNKTQQLFAFLDSPVVVRNATPPVSLYAYKEASPPVVSKTSGTTGKPAAASDRRLRFNTSLIANQQDLLGDLLIQFEKPLKFLDTAQLRLTRDSAFKPVAYSLSLDSSRKKITIKTTWQEDTRYNLVLGKDFAEDSLAHRLLKSDTLRFTTRKKSDYGVVAIKIRNVDLTQKPVLQFVQNGVVMISAPIPNGTYSNPLFLPGEYELRVFYDRNGNGVWDPGQFFGTRRQPEVVKPVDRRATIKAGMDNDFEITL